MANPNGAKGTAFESTVLQGFLTLDENAHRLGKQGTQDKGDIWLPKKFPFVVECKNVSRMLLSQWLAEAEREALCADRPYGLVVHKRKGKGAWQDQYVTLTLGTFIGLIGGWNE